MRRSNMKKSENIKIFIFIYKIIRIKIIKI